MQPSRSDFCHPYQPYDIQLDFMKCLYESIEERKVAIFESPTGTGKSLSLICGALTWLRDNARREIEGTFNESVDESTDWLAAAEKLAHKRRYLQELAETEQKLSTIRRKELARYEAKNQARVTKKLRVNGHETDPKDLDDDSFMLDDYDSSDDKVNNANDAHTLSSSTRALLEKLKPAAREETECDEDRVKIIFCSRTHSQLSQFINELRRVAPPSGVPWDEDRPITDQVEEIVKHVPLGSRKNLCINDKVLRLSSPLAINERCLELQKTGMAKDQRCKYLPGKDDRERVEAFRDRAMANIRDIEDLGKLGQKMELCPYYASRSAVFPSEVLTLPYPLLLQKSAREALGISIKNNVVVIDEAHNLMDAIADTLSLSLSLDDLELAKRQVFTYVERFKNKLKGSNRMYITQLIRLLNSFTNCLQHAPGLQTQNESAVTAADLMSGKGVDQVRPHKLLQYLVQSKLGHKVEGYVDAHAKDGLSASPKGTLLHFQNFLMVLMNPDSEGRFFMSRQDGKTSIRYTLLDPREHFRDIVEQARAVILAGGTMSPMSDYADYLFSYLDPSRLSTFSSGHVIPKKNMFVSPVTAGPAGLTFDFTFEKRNSSQMASELGSLILRICQTVPDGVVVFFPSYDYLAQVTNIWKISTDSESAMVKISAVKKVFEDVRDVRSDDLIREYTKAIDEGSGAIMLSVVGGKLSEGINFSDKLGRAVVAVGLPFPNMHSAEWKAKLEHIKQTRYKRCSDIEGVPEDQSRAQAKLAAKDFYENACMRAVNQSIGRAIRHKNDYAAILLVDRRFTTARIQGKLPQWIRSSMNDLDTVRSWSSIEQDLRLFFQNKT